MSFEYLTNTSLDEARERYIASLIGDGRRPPTEMLPVGRSCGRVTAGAVYANICAPHYNASAMDGIALRAELSFGAGETTPVTLSPEQFSVVDTGDPVPAGCDAVVMIEDVVFGDDGSAKLYAPAVPWQHIRQIGEDICAGEMLLPSGSLITAPAVGAMLAAGVLNIRVNRRPLVGIIPTGDEIVPPTQNPKSGDIVEFNSSIFSGMLSGWGADSKVFPIVPDDLDKIVEALRSALETCDAVIINAGSSAGREDYTAAAVMEVGRVIIHGIAMKPGKPAILGKSGGKPVIGVPGYPVSGIIVMNELFRPVLCRCFGCPEPAYEYAEAVLSSRIVSGLKYREFVRVRLGYSGKKLIAAPLSRGAGVVTSFMRADGILDIPQSSEGIEAGETVRVRLLCPLSALENTLVITGSHDPLIDEIADLMHISDPGFRVSSTHVGSMGGIMAVRRGEAHAAGVHLLNEADGVYNKAYIRKYFPDGGVKLVECVGRTQGLMISAGNPKRITGLADLTRVSYVNRQKGSGTRVLLDYLLKKQGISPDGIRGYDREEFTHTSVAAQIAGGTADAGLGIFSAAKMYGLDFLPICTEQYDLLIPDSAWDTKFVRQLIHILKSPEFAERLGALGGYTLENPGRVREQ